MEHHTQHTHHHHDHAEHEPKRPLTSRLWGKVAEYGNYAVAAFQATASVLTGQVGAAVDSAHSGLDGVGFRKERQNLHNSELSEQQRLRNRKIVFWLFSSTSLVLGAKAGAEIALSEEPDPSMLTIYSASASVGLNAFLFSGIYKGVRERRKKAQDKDTRYTADEKMQLKHFFLLDTPSAVLSLTGAVGQYYHPSVGNTAGIISGALGVWLFRPTEKNIGHECHHGPGHQHDDHAHNHYNHHLRDTDVPNKRPLGNRLRRRVAAAALAFGALTSTAVLSSDGTSQNSAVQEQTTQPIQEQPRDVVQLPSALPEHMPFLPEQPHIDRTPETTSATTIGNNVLTIYKKADGSITKVDGVLGTNENPWSITEDAITLSGKKPTQQDIAKANPFMATDKQNQAKNLQPGSAFHWIIKDGELVTVNS